MLLLLPGCSWFGDKADPTADWSANQFYTEAKTALNEGNYQTAIEYFEKLQARYPFGRFAQQAQLELIYAHYKDDEPDQAIAAADRFIRTHPRHPFVDYAYYLKGLVNFNRSDSVIERMFPNDPTIRPRTCRHSMILPSLCRNFLIVNMHRMRASACCFCAITSLSMN